MSRSIRALAVAGMSAAFALGTAPAAQAGTVYYAYPDSPNAARIQFHDDGDIWKVCDTRSDGYGVVLHLWDGYNYHRMGAGDCDVRNTDYREGRSVDYRACLLTASDRVFGCGDWVHATA